MLTQPLMRVKRVVNGAIRPLGYEIHDISRVKTGSNGWEQYKFITPDGSFDYEQYRVLQETKATRERDVVCVTEKNIEFLADYLKRHLDNIRFGLCHGTKHGKEQAWFIKYLRGNVDVVGTEISAFANTIPNTVHWDFHETKPEWLESADFVYSNALDHAYDPRKAIEAWMNCVRPGGYCIVEWHVYSESLNITDPFSADIVQLVYAVTKWGNGRFCVREIIPTVTNPEYVNFVIIYKL